MPTNTLFDLTTDLRTLGGGRVWSLMVSLFGDLAQGKGDHIEGPVLSAIMAALAVKPEAARVALHRLRNDGWIASEKHGRISQHSLTDEGRSKSRAASPRIYTSPDDVAGDWQMVMLDPAASGATDEMESRGFVPVQANIFVGKVSLDVPADAAVFYGKTAPLWLGRALIPARLEDGYAALAKTLKGLANDLPEPDALSALEIAVLRCLVVHNWRRLVLKHPAPPQGLIDPNGAYHHCLFLVADLLARYPRPALADVAQD